MIIGTHKTSIFTEPNLAGLDTTKVIFHNTAVVQYNSQTILLNTLGWETPTTKKRMNQTSEQFNLGFRVFQKNWDWFVEFNGIVKKFDGDTITIHRNGFGWENNSN